MLQSRLTHLKNLFFIRRRPVWDISRAWKKPDNTDQYEMQLEYEGFISVKNWKEDNLEDFPLLMQDLKDLEQHLLPAFWEFNQKAKHFQNRFYLYQWVFMLGAFFTTILGAITTYAAALGGDADSVARFTGIATAVVSGVTFYVNYMSSQGAPQQRWAKSRRLAEELRMTYYRYVAHLDPYAGVDRVQQLRRKVLQIRRKENQDV